MLKRIIFIYLFISIFQQPALNAQVLTIERCYDIARNRNLVFKRQQSEVRLNSIREQQAIYSFFPKIKAESNLGNKNEYNSIYNNNTFNVALEQPIYHFGELTYKVNETKARCMGSIFELAENELQLEKNIYQAYMNIIRQRKLKKNREIAINRVKKQIGFITDEVDKNRREASSITRWKVLRASYDDDLVRLNNDLSDSYINLKKVLEYNITAEIRITPCGLEEFDANLEIVKRYYSGESTDRFQQSLFDYAKIFSPAVKKRDQDVKVAQFSLASDRAGNLPKLDFTPRYDGPGLTTGPNPLQRQPNLNIGFTVRFSFLDMTSWQNIALKSEQLNQVRIDKNIFIRDRVALISSNFLRSYASMQKVSIALQQTLEARSYLKRMEEKYMDKNASDIDLIDAYNSCFNSKAQEINALYNYYNDRKDLYILIGCSDYLYTPSIEEFIENRKEIDYDLNDLYYKDAQIFELYDEIKNDNPAGVQRLLKNNPALMNGTIYTKWTPLHFAAYFGNLRIAEYLLKNSGMKSSKFINSRTIMGLTPLFIASDQGNEDVLKLLIMNGADVNIPSGISQWTPLMRASKRGFRSIVEILVSAGSRINDRSVCGWTALHNAAEEGHIDIIKILLNASSDPGIRTNSGCTAYDLAQAEDFDEAAVMLRINENPIKSNDRKSTMKKSNNQDRKARYNKKAAYASKMPEKHKRKRI